MMWSGMFHFPLLLIAQQALCVVALQLPSQRRNSRHVPPSHAPLMMTPVIGCALNSQYFLPSSTPESYCGLNRCRKSALYATPAAGGNMEALFPSDDSDYEQTEGNVAVEIKSTTAAASESNPPNDDGDNLFQWMPLGDEFVDPFDMIADWVANRFEEQSLQSKGEEDESKYIMESYSPGSTLDAIARASSTYTPLSYQIRTVVRVLLPSILMAVIATAVYPSMADWLIHLPAANNGGVGTYDATTLDGGVTDNLLYNDRVLTVLSNDLSQYVQNILTTCALLFGMLVGQTYYFMYQQQELVFYALFAEVTEAKSLLEQISLMTYGRPGLYPSLLSRMNDYVQNDLKLLSVRDPIAVTSGLPKDDPLESILYATSVGLPGVVYDTVKSLRQARADRCGALQRKLPVLHVYCLRLLGVIVLSTFPVCGSGSQAIAPNVLVLQSYLFGVLAFALTLVLNVVEELRDSRTRMGAYNVDGILEVMVGGLERELEERLEGKFWGVGVSPGLPSRVAAGTGDNGGTMLAMHDGNVNSNDYLPSLESADAIGDNIVANDTVLDSSRRRKVRQWLRKKLIRSQQ